MPPIFYIIISILLYLIIHSTLTRGYSLLDINPTVMSIFVTALCVIGIHQVFEKSEFNFLLLPYAALGLALPLVLLMRWWSKSKKPKDEDFEDESRLER